MVQWQFQSFQVTRAGDTRGVCGKLMGGENLVPPPNCRLVCCPYYWTALQHRPARQYRVSNMHNWPEFYPGNARACPGLELPMQWWLKPETMNSILVTGGCSLSSIYLQTLIQLYCLENTCITQDTATAGHSDRRTQRPQDTATTLHGMQQEAGSDLRDLICGLVRFTQWQ